MDASFLESKPWWKYLEEDLSELLKESFILLEETGHWKQNFHDYSFVVFPAAKAYEGFLKKIFLDRGFISREDYYGSRFRIGKALNPSLEKRFRHESVYDKIVSHCGNSWLADLLWVTWKDSRNLLFHWFPDEKRAINLDEAKIKIEQIVDAVDAAYKECKINKFAASQ